MSTERDLLYGVLSLQADLINTEQFVEACTAWSAQRNGSLESLLLEWGYLSPTDHRQVEYLMHRRLAKHAGDVHACLATISDDRWRYALASLNDPYVQQIISSVPLSPAVDREQANLSIHDIDLGATSRSTQIKLAKPRSLPLNQITLAVTVFVILLGATSATYLLTRERSRVQDYQAELAQALSQAAEERQRAERFAGEGMAERTRAAAERDRAGQERAHADALRVEIKKMRAENERLRQVAREAVGQASPVAVKPKAVETRPTTSPAEPGGEHLAALLTTVAQLEQQLQANGTMPEPQRDLAEACKKLADEYVRLGQLDKAEPHYQRALVLCEKLAREYAKEPAYRAVAAGCRLSLGLLFRDQGRLDPALLELKQAEAGFVQLVDTHPFVDAYRGALGQAQQQLAGSEFLAGQLKDADASARRALGMLEKATDSSANRARQASVHELLGRILYRAQRLVEAEAAHRRALELREPLVRQHPENQDFLRALASSHQQLATLYQATGRLVQAEAAAQRALLIRENLARDLPKFVELRREVALSRRTLGGIHLASGRFLQAESAYRRAVTELEEFAKGADGAGVAEDLGAAYFELAGLYALQAETGSKDQREQHSTKALDALDRARTVGFFASAPNRERLSRDAQFDSLRKRADFRKLVDGLKAPGTASR